MRTVALLAVLVAALLLASPGECREVLVDKAYTTQAVHWSMPYPRVYLDTAKMDSAGVDTSLCIDIRHGGGEYLARAYCDTLDTGAAGSVLIEYQLGAITDYTFVPAYDGLDNTTWWAVDVIRTAQRYYLYSIHIGAPFEAVRFRLSRLDTGASGDTADTQVWFGMRPK